ncbi:MAG: hypothetical protein DMG96_09200 [Acidobacteria bacterium]|nr:MAG: hypothetical protein DMG98_16265 [Acidobacteriota bacterium]PYV78142.1 MAG: hypothetical protein DMG96_09200 [Acidobacteriota bacterium]
MNLLRKKFGLVLRLVEWSVRSRRKYDQNLGLPGGRPDCRDQTKVRDNDLKRSRPQRARRVSIDSVSLIWVARKAMLSETVRKLRWPLAEATREKVLLDRDAQYSEEGACSCWAGVTFYFFRRYMLSAWITLATVLVLLVYKFAVIGW